MKIYSMTATFGKLEHETLTLQPGLNVISAGNEWGKSTWCAFLTAMLYGLDTRAKSTKKTLADKERYAPWSGSPMSGRIDLNWNGRDITIERKTKGRIPLGEFRAYETGTGLTVAELDGSNCGEMLLGVERSVFLRSGFIRFSDLNVTDDEALRRRLNNLVTTGDESCAADGLAVQLKELKNKVRHNRTGLLPQAEAERDRLEGRLKELQRLEDRNDEILRRMDELEDWRMALENHRDAMAYQASLEDAAKVAAAEKAWRRAGKRYEELQSLCGALTARETAREKLEQLRLLEDRQLQLRDQLRTLPQPRKQSPSGGVFAGLTPDQIRDQTGMDALAYRKLEKADGWGILGLTLFLLGLTLAWFKPVPGLVCICLGLGALIWKLILIRRQVEGKIDLEARYESGDPERWPELGEAYIRLQAQRRQETERLNIVRSDLERRVAALNQEIASATEDQGLELCRRDWEGILSVWEARDDALGILDRSRDHYRDVRAMARHAKRPEFPDRLTHSEAYTARLLDECLADRQRLENLQGQCRGSMEALGSKLELTEQLEAIQARIRELEITWTALNLAQETLNEAASELQRRFAPRIARKAGALMSRMTEGRYDRLSIGEDLSLRAGALQEDTLHEALWRSDGTVDQLYLALRLAVAEELLPGVPLVLDDALVRFDDQRLKAAMEILKDEASGRQVILFTCHNREKNML